MKCRLCNLDFKNIQRHLTLSHSNISHQEYYDQYILIDVKEKECHYRNCKKITKFRNITIGYNKYCNSICCNKEKIYDQNYINKQKQIQKISQNKPEVKQRSRLTATEQWKNLDIRRRTIETLKKTVLKSDVKKRMSQSAIKKFQNIIFKQKFLESRKKIWNDEFRLKFKQCHNSESAKINHSIATKKQWTQNLFYKYNMLTFLKSSQYKIHMSKLVTYKMLNNLWNPYYGNYKHGYYYSAKNNFFLFYRSSLELSVYKLLDKDDTVSHYKYEPFRISYIDCNGDSKFYIPDILITKNNGDKELIEIKPDIFVNDENNQCKIKAANEYCIKNNMIFRVWLESEIKNKQGKTNEKDN